MSRDVDEIIVPILVSIGCELKGNTHVAEWDADTFYHAVATCMRAIDSQGTFNMKLPKGKAARFRMTSLIAGEIKNLGYSQPVGYEAFLYPNEKDMRGLLMWLVDKVPKVDEGNAEEELEGEGVSQHKLIQVSLAEWVNQSYDPLGKVGQAQVQNKPFTTVPLVVPTTVETSPETQAYFDQVQSLYTLQPTDFDCFFGSALELSATEVAVQQEQERDWERRNQDDGAIFAEHAAALENIIAEAFRNSSTAEMDAVTAAIFGGTASSQNSVADNTFIRRSKFNDKNENAAVIMGDKGQLEQVDAVAPEEPTGPTEEELDAAAQEEAKTLQVARDAEVTGAQESVKQLQDTVKKMDSKTVQNEQTSHMLEAEIIKMDEEIKKLTDAYKVIDNTNKLMNSGNADENMKKLNAIVAQSTARIVTLGEEWEKYRQPILAKYRRNKQLLRERKDEVGVKVEHIKQMRIEMKKKAEDIRAKAKLHTQLVEELNKLPKSVNRQVYVKRIMDVLRNLRKQDQLIKTVLADVRQVQKEINIASQAKIRSFDVADEVIYQAALKESQGGVPVNQRFGAPAYQNVVALRDSFNRLVEQVEETGRCKNEIRDVTAKVEELAKRNTSENMKRIVTDLEQVKAEDRKSVV